MLKLALITLTATLTLADAAAPQRAQRYIPRHAGEAAAWQTKTRALLAEPLRITDLLNTPRAPLAPETVSTADKGAYILDEITVQSTPGRRITLAVARPKGAESSRPAVIAIHGHGGSRMSPFDAKAQERAGIYKEFGARLAEKGYIVVAPEVGQHEIYEPGRTLMGERLWDCIRAVDYAASLPEVDASRIGCAGLSLGGEMTMWLGAMDTRIAATVSAGFLTNMDHMEQNHCMCWKFDGLRDLVDWPDVYGLIAPRALMCQNGLKEPENDFTVPLARKALEQIKPVYADLNAPDNLTLHVHEGAHEIDLAPLLAFLDKHLKNP